MSPVAGHPPGKHVAHRPHRRYPRMFLVTLAGAMLLAIQGVRAGQSGAIQELWHFEAGG